MTKEEIFALIQRLLADILEVEPNVITITSSFSDDLEADSLALIELVEALEEELSTDEDPRLTTFRIDDEDLDDLKTVRDAVDYLLARLPKDKEN